MKKLTLLFVLFILSCGGLTDAHTKSDGIRLDGELSDCKIYLVNVNGFVGKDIYVIRCPKSTVTSSWTHNCGKNCTSTEFTMTDSL